MSPDKIIKYLFRVYEPFLERMDASSRNSWGELLFPGRPKQLDYNHFNKLKTTDKSTTGLVLDALKSAEVRAGICRKLGIDRLFDAANVDELEVILRPYLLTNHEAPAARGRALVEPKPFADGVNCVSAAEDAAIRALVNRLREEPNNVVCWKDAPAVGSMFIAYALGGGAHLKTLGVKQTYLLCPFEGYTEEGAKEDEEEVPFDCALKELREKLKLSPLASADKVLQTLEDQDSILLVLHPDLLPESRPSELRELLRAAGNRVRNTATVLLFGLPRFAVQNCRYFPFQVAPGKESENNQFFEQHWKRYCVLRKHVPADEQGTRFKRAQTYFADEKSSVCTRPAAVRMLAFLASNYETFSYFDPTAGWAELSNMPVEQLPVEIRLHIDEVNSLLRGNSTDPVLRVVELCSTALYWLSRDAAEDLIRLPRSMKWETFASAVNKVHNKLITTSLSQLETEPEEAVPARASKVENYRMDLATRAVAQDRWMQRDAFGRSRAHHAVAERLFRHCNDKELLSAEFPFEPHWGRSRIHFLAECLRHLIRACGPTTPETAAAAAKNEPVVHAAGAFPRQPQPGLEGQGGCDPREVLNFCFETIFWHDLNDNRHSGNVHNRKLARQHGAYQLTGELLELMSSARRLGRPHPALDARHHARYYREVVYALLDLGQLEKALQTCEKLICLSGPDKAITVANVDYQLDRIVVLTAMDRLDEANGLLDEVETFVAPMVKKPEKIDIRLKARRAQLLYLRGNSLDAALAEYESLAKEETAAIARDVAHTYIATLGALGGKDYLQRALTICLQNLFYNSSEGLHHDALGFRVSLAHLLRKTDMLDAAETTLDQVRSDILKFGCSERSYLAFLLEAGRIVAQYPSRVARAYAAYLRPCLDRALSNEYIRTAETALKEAEVCLGTLLAFLESRDVPEDEVKRMLVDARSVDFISRRPEVDPRYAFGATQVEEWLPKLATVSAVNKEMDALRAVKERLRGIRATQKLSPPVVH